MPAKTDPLVGRCFVIFGDDGKPQRQGLVKARVHEDVYLVRYFEWMFGMPNTMQCVSIYAMTPEGKNAGSREKGQWEFFEDDAHLRSWMEDR